MSAQYPTRPVPAASALVYRQGSVLLVQRKTDPGAGKWSLPGGKIELGESSRSAAARETLEESGVRVEATKLLDAVDVVIKDSNQRIQYHFLILVYLASYDSGNLQVSPETMDVRWVPLPKTLEYDLTSTSHEVLSAFMRSPESKTAPDGSNHS